MPACRSIACSLVFCVAALGGRFGAAAAEAPRMNAGLSHMLGLSQLAVVDGRIAVGGIASFQTNRGEFKTTERDERLEVTQAGPSTTLHYVLTTPQLQLTWDLLAGNEFHVRRQLRGTAGAHAADQAAGGAEASLLLVFSQPAEGALKLALGEGDERQEYRGATLWHLFLAEPELCRDTVAPLIEVVKPGWKLAQTAAACEDLLLKSAGAASQPSRDAWLRLVADLGHERFAARNAAERRLRQEGQQVLPFLLSLDEERLDAEQRQRVRKLIRRLSDKPGAEDELGDTPQQIVRMLARDPSVWIGLLERDDESRRRIAAEQLSRLLNETIDFDPAADAERRHEQVRALRERTESVPSPP